MSRQPAKTLPLSMAQRALSRTASGVPVHSCARRKIAIILLFLGLSAAVLGAEDTREFKAIRHNESSAALFAPPPALRVLGPSHFPPPTLPLGEDVEVLLEASFGAHRADQDAIIAFAEGYRLGNYMMFMETLASTGYTGDVVLAIADDRVIREDVKEYLQTYAQGDTNKPGVVVYQLPLYCENDPNHWRRVMRSGDLDGFQMCQVGHHVYGWRDELGHVRETASDPREGRTVATIRYEWYWMVSLRYQKHAWLMLLDARDSLFQTNPFADVPRETENPDRPDGLLYFFGENANATRLGKSRKNRNWLAKGYGSGTIDILQDYPTICSGSSMGEQVAIETVGLSRARVPAVRWTDCKNNILSHPDSFPCSVFESHGQ